MSGIDEQDRKKPEGIFYMMVGDFHHQSYLSHWEHPSRKIGFDKIKGKRVDMISWDGILKVLDDDDELLKEYEDMKLLKEMPVYE